MKLKPHAIPLEALGAANTQLISFVLGENNRAPNQALKFWQRVSPRRYSGRMIDLLFTELNLDDVFDLPRITNPH